MDEEVAALIHHKVWGEAPYEPPLIVLTCVKGCGERTGYLRLRFSRAAPFGAAPLVSVQILSRTFVAPNS